MFGSALTLASFIKVIYSVFLGPKSDTTLSIKEDVGFGMQLPMIILSLLCLVFGIYYLFPLNTFIFPGAGIVAEPLGLWSSRKFLTLLLRLSLKSRGSGVVLLSSWIPRAER